MKFHFYRLAKKVFFGYLARTQIIVVNKTLNQKNFLKTITICYWALFQIDFMFVHRNWSIFKTSDMNINFWANIYNFCGFKIFFEKWYNLGGFFGDHPLSSDVISFVNGESVNFNDVVQSFWNKDFWVFDLGARTAGCNSPLQRWSIVTKYPFI